MAFNMKLFSHHDLDSFGGLGEGIAVSLTQRGRRMLRRVLITLNIPEQVIRSLFHAVSDVAPAVHLSCHPR